MHAPLSSVPHQRTLRKAREQVKQMVTHEVSPRQIRLYLHRWCSWWVRTVESWQYRELLQMFIDVCWDAKVSSIAASLLLAHIKNLPAAVVTVVHWTDQAPTCA
jgi:hypothetical protein